MRVSLVFFLLCLSVTPAMAKDMSKCGTGKCTECHSLDVKEAKTLLGNAVDKVHSVKQSEVPALWVVDIEKDRQHFPIFVDYSKKYLFTGNVIRLADMSNLTQQYHAQMNKIAVNRIPLEDALLLGSPSASTKVIVFTDPECPYCSKMHMALKEVVARDPDIAFLIKMFPLKMHPNAYAISKSIVCSKSLDLLEKSFEKQPVPPATCETGAVDETLALATELGIRSTPTLVLPDGQIMPGYKEADDLLKLLGSKTLQSSAK